MKQPRLSAALIVLLVVLSTTGAYAQPASAALLSGADEAFTDAALDQRGLLGWSPSDDVVKYGSEGYPGWVVTYEEGAEDDLRTWVNASSDRTVRYHNNDSRIMVISAPPTHAGISWSFGVTTLRELSYVELPIGINLRVEVDPIRDSELQDASSWSKPSGYYMATWGGTKGTLEADGAAWDSEVNETGLDDVREAIGADAVSVNGSGLRVAVLDTGLDYSQDLHGDRVVAGYNVLTGETLNTSLNASERDYSILADGNGHGSWVTSAIAANGSGPNATGIAPGAEIVPVKVLGDDGSGSTADIAEGLEWACEEADADVISMSLGSAFPSAQLEAEINECLEDEGVSAIVVAGGNNRLTTRYLQSPGDSTNVITVAATDARPLNESETAYFSAVGPDPETGVEPTIGAPGFKINLQTADGNRTLSGTSMATPIVSGAILLELDADPSRIGDQDAIREHLRETADRVENAGVTEIGAGRVNAQRLVEDNTSESSQAEVATDDSTARDTANEALSGSFWRGLASGLRLPSFTIALEPVGG